MRASGCAFFRRRSSFSRAVFCAFVLVSVASPRSSSDTQRMAVVAYGMGADQLFVSRLVGPAVAGDVVVVARESEVIRVTADECCHGKATVTARDRTVNHNQINVAHDCTKNELIIAVSTVMMNWMMFFHFFINLNRLSQTSNFKFQKKIRVPDRHSWALWWRWPSSARPRGSGWWSSARRWHGHAA